MPDKIMTTASVEVPVTVDPGPQILDDPNVARESNIVELGEAKKTIGMVIARPLTSISWEAVRHKDPAIRLRAIEFKCRGGMRLEQMQYVGFVPCPIAELRRLDGKPIDPKFHKDGFYSMGDLIMCKIARDDYDGALQWNADVAHRRAQPVQVKRESLAAVEGVLDEVRPQSMQSKLRAFAPTAQIVNEISGNNL